MADALVSDIGVAHPLLKRRRHRRRWRPTTVQLRLGIILGLAGVLLVGGGLWLSRPVPADPRAALIGSLVALDAGNYSAARNDALTAAAAAPRSATAQAVLARAYLELDDGVAAQGALDRAVQAGMPVRRLRQLRAHARLLQGDPVRALAEAQAALPPYAGYAARIAARATAAQGDVTGARAMLESLVAATPGDGAAWADLAQLRFTAGDLAGASAAAAGAVQRRPRDPRALTLEGQIVRARYGLVAALPWFEAALRRDAYYPPALVEDAATLGELGRNGDMLVALRRLLAARPGDGRAFYLQAVLAARAGKLPLAGALLARCGGLPAATLLGGGIDYAAGRYAQAAAKWRALADAQPMNVTVRRLLAAALLRSGDARGSLAVLRPLVMRADADSYALTLAARGFEAIGDRANAARFLDRAQGGDRGAPAAFATDDTVGTLAAEAAEAPADPTYALGVLRGLIGSGDLAGAVAQARQLAGATPGAPAAQLAYGDTLAVAGRDPRPPYARAADLQFDEPTMLRLVDAQARGGRSRDAAATLALYLSQNPQSLAAQRLLGHLQLGAGETDAAIETLEGVRRRVGNADVALLVDLALAYAADDGNERGGADVALRYARTAYALAPMGAAAADAYGVALAAGGQLDPARQLMTKARALAPRDVVIAAHARALD